MSTIDPMELTIQRRHSPTCPDKAKGPNFLKCRGKCILRAIGYDDDGNRVRESLKTRDLARAAKRMAEFETKRGAGPAKPLAEAVAAFAQRNAAHAPETKRKYERILRFLCDFCSRRQIASVGAVTIEHLDAYAAERGKSNQTWLKEIEVMRQFFAFCMKRRWCTENPAADLKRPKIGEPNDVVPFTREEIARIIAACDEIGSSAYERARARAMVLLMRFAGLRVSDVVTLTAEHISGNYLVKKAVKNGRLIHVELPSVVLEALDRVPRPREAARESTFYFASGSASLRSLVKGAERTMSSVFKRAKVAGAFPHRFRHTLASDLMAKGIPVEVVASILADTPGIVRRHYLKWTPEYQSRKDEAIRQIHGTNPAQPTNDPTKELKINALRWWPGTESNRRHADFQSAALPTELPSH
jgi:site-specific recombinase XerD